MKTLELFCGTKSFSKVASKLGYYILTIDNEPTFNPILCLDILKLKPNCDVLNDEFDIIWASPPCTAFSVASIGRNWNKDKTPKSKNAEMGLQLLDKTIQIIIEINPKSWYIENPRGMMRKKIDAIFSHYGLTLNKDYRRLTITYCQYGDVRMKPTDIWTNDFNWKPKPICKNGAKCHIFAPRGSRTGTQGLKNAKERGIIPEQLFYEILESKTI